MKSRRPSHRRSQAARRSNPEKPSCSEIQSGETKLLSSTARDRVCLQFKQNLPESQSEDRKLLLIVLRALILSLYCLHLEIKDATMLVFVTPHQFMEGICKRLIGKIKSDAEAISLVKGMDVKKEGPCMISSIISEQLGINCSVLMGANIANEIAVEKFSEVPVGYKDNKEIAEKWVKLFSTPYFMVTAVQDVEGVELCGTLKNVVAIAAFRGMMYYRKALMLQVYLERMTAGDVEADVSSVDATETKGFELSPEARAQADLKFTYVVTCQIYGRQKEEQKPEAADIALLMQRNEALRVAYIDVVETLKDGRVHTEYFSKLVKADINGKDKEIYSIKLPGDPKLGEGKPENQNHAIVFTRGNAMQTIDMNQGVTTFNSDDSSSAPRANAPSSAAPNSPSGVLANEVEDGS